MAGAILTLVDQGNALPAGAVRAEMASELPMIYCVPYLVVTCELQRSGTDPGSRGASAPRRGGTFQP
jgi:hypothetical protein